MSWNAATRPGSAAGSTTALARPVTLPATSPGSAHQRTAQRRTTWLSGPSRRTILSGVTPRHDSGPSAARRARLQRLPSNTPMTGPSDHSRRRSRPGATSWGWAIAGRSKHHPGWVIPGAAAAIGQADPGRPSPDLARPHASLRPRRDRPGWGGQPAVRPWLSWGVWTRPAGRDWDGSAAGHPRDLLGSSRHDDTRTPAHP